MEYTIRSVDFTLFVLRLSKRSAVTDLNRFSIPDNFTSTYLKDTKMATVAEFIDKRQQIEALVKQVALLAERKVALDSAQRLEQARQLLETLKTMADNDVQEICVGRLTRELASLQKKVGSLKSPKRAVKKQPAL